MSNTGTNITIIEKNLPMDRITPMVEALDMNPKRFLSTVMLACERNPRMMDFPVGQHVQWASASAVLGLEPDGVTGQAFPIPFGGRDPKVQLVIGYKGFNTMAGRAGITINSGVIREGDEFDPVLQPGKPFAVRQAFGQRARANMLGAWAQAQMPNGAFGATVLLDMSEILAVKAKSPGARKKSSPWNDASVGMPAMAQKTAVRRLQRTLPSLITPGRQFSTHNIGAQMDMLHEEVGHHTTVDLDGHLRDEGPIIEAKPMPDEVRPEIALPNGNTASFGSWNQYGSIVSRIGLTENQEALRAIADLNKERFAEWRIAGHTEAADAIEVALADALDDY